MTKYEEVNVYNEQEHRSSKMEVKEKRVQIQGTIYIDSVFVLNFVMDLYLLKLTAQALGKTATARRILSASLIGAAGYCLVFLIPGISYSLKIMLGMLPLGMLMVRIVCRTKGMRELLYGTGYLFTFSFLIGGFMVFLKSRLSFFGYSGSLLFMTVAGLAGYKLCSIGLKVYARSRKNRFCQVELMGDTGPVRIIALVDTGNGLTEPISKRPVAILEEESWEKLQHWMKPEKFKLIPYHSIGRDNGMLEGYEIGAMEVRTETGRKQYEKVIIAVFRGKISSKGGYQMILPPELSI